MEKKAVVNGTTEVAEEPLQSSEVWLPGVMHMEADLLNLISDIWPGEGKVMQGTSETPVGGGISGSKWGALNLRQLGLGVNRSETWVAVSHPCPLQDIKSILTLVE